MKKRKKKKVHKLVRAYLATLPHPVFEKNKYDIVTITEKFKVTSALFEVGRPDRELPRIFAESLVENQEFKSAMCFEVRDIDNWHKEVCCRLDIILNKNRI